jgi:surface-anchored protein
MSRHHRHTRRASCRIEALESRLTPALLDTFLTTEHADLGIGFTGSAWSLTIDNEDKNETYSADKALLYVSVDKSRQTAPAGFSFLGVQAGQDFYQLPAGQDPNLLYLGLSAESVSSNAIDSYSPAAESGGRVSATGKYVRLTLHDVKGANGTAAPGHFSAWQVPLSSPVVFMASSDGISTGDGAAGDSLWLLAGGHQHFNFGFSAPGRYEVTFRASAFLNDNNPNTVGAKSQSGLVTYYFSVGGAGQMRFDSPTYTVDEAAGSRIVTVTRVGGADGRLTVNYAAASGTATAGSDFTAVSGTLTFNDLETTKTFSIPITADNKAEGSETVALSLSSPGPSSFAAYLSANEQPGRHLVSSSATATLTITENSLPTISAIQNRSTDQGKATGAISFTVGDAETPAGSLVVTAKSSNSTLVPVANVTLGGSGANRTVNVTPATNQPGNATITLTVTDSSGGSAESSFVITFDDIPEDPTLAAISNQTTNEDVPLDVPLTVGDGDGDTVTVTVPNAADFSSLASVAIVGTPANPVLRITPVDNAFGSQNAVTVRATDSTGRFVERSFILTVSPVNDPVTAVNDSFLVMENSPATPFAVLANDSAGPSNENQTLVITAVGTPNRLGSVSIQGSVIMYTPAPNFFGVESFTYTVTDGADTKTATVTVVVEAASRSPVGEADLFVVNASGDALKGNVLVNDQDPNGDEIEARLFAEPAHGTVSMQADGSFVYTPGASFTGSDTFAYLPVQKGTILSGHADVGIGFHNGNFDLHVHDEETDTEYEPSDSTIFVGARAKVALPSGLGFTGANPGDSVWILPGAAEKPGVVFLGLATEEIATGVFTNNSITLTLDSFTGPGDFSLWTTDSLGNVLEGLSTNNGFSGDSVSLTTGSHAHYNWAFTQPGEYQLTMRAAGQLAGGGSISQAATYTFFVSPTDPFTQTTVREGHVDVGIGFEDGAFDLHIHDEEADIEFEAGEVPIFVSDAALIARPAGTAFDFIGAQAGERVWNIRADQEIPGLVFLGLATEEISKGAFVGDKVTLSLKGVQGPGAFSLWTAGATPSVKMASFGGIDASDKVELTTGSHNHFNWTFSAPGEYAITFEVSGTPAGASSPIISQATYNFSVSNGFPLVGSPVKVEVGKAGRLDFLHTITKGHADVGIAFEDGHLELHVHDEEAEAEFAPSEALIFVGPDARITRPADTKFDFLGVAAGAPIWVLPAIENPNLPYLGIGTEEVAPGTFIPGSLKLSLAHVSGPGEFFIYTVDGVGAVTVGMSTADGIGADDTIPLLEGSHGHRNWAFTAAGRYEVGFEASATLPDGTQVSDHGVFVFSVDNMGKVSFASAASAVAENVAAGFVNLQINRAGGLDGELELSFSTAGTASADVDYKLSGTVVFLDGQSSATLKVALVNDFLFENPETASITISSANPIGSAGGAGGKGGDGVGATATHALTINSEDRRFASDPTRVSVIPTAAGTLVRLIDTRTNFTRIFTPIPGYSGGYNTALEDIDNDGIRDLIVGTTGGTVGRVRVLNGATSQILRDFIPYSTAYRLAVHVGVGDLNGDNRPDIITGTAPGAAPRVVAYSGSSVQPLVLANFLAFANTFRGGVMVAAGDTNGDGAGEIIATAASGSNLVRIFNGSGTFVRQFAALATANRGLSVVTADLDRDGRDEIIVGSLTGVSRLGIYDNLGRLVKPIQLPLGTASTAGIRVAAADYDGNAITDILLSRSGGRGSEPRLLAIRFSDMRRIADLSFALLSMDESVSIR